MAIVGCKCDVRGLRDFETKLAALVTEIHGTNTTDGLEYSLPDLAERLTRLETGMSNKETVGKECIDSARKEIESMLTGGVAAGCLQKRGLKGMTRSCHLKMSLHNIRFKGAYLRKSRLLIPFRSIRVWNEIDLHDWASLRENLSSGFPTKRVSNQSRQQQRLARKLKFHL